MDGERLREMESLIDELQAIQTRIGTIIKTLEKTEKLTPQLKSSFANAKTASEVEHLYQPFKVSSVIQCSAFEIPAGGQAGKYRGSDRQIDKQIEKQVDQQTCMGKRRWISAK